MTVITTPCSAVAEVMIEVVPPAACAVGVYTLNPQTCGPWMWLTAHPGYKEVAKRAVELGCDVAVEAGPKYYKIIIHDTERGVRKAKQTYRALNTPHGMAWLMRYLSGY